MDDVKVPYIGPWLILNLDEFKGLPVSIYTPKFSNFFLLESIAFQIKVRVAMHLHKKT
jgi:hypothetical protein